MLTSEIENDILNPLNYLQLLPGCPPTDARKTFQVNAVPNNRSVKFTWTYDANPEDTGFSLSISGGHPAKTMNITMREYIFPSLGMFQYVIMHHQKFGKFYVVSDSKFVSTHQPWNNLYTSYVNYEVSCTWKFY